MAWFDQTATPKLLPASFDDVTPRQRRQPSWLAKPRRSSNPPRQVTVPPPPPIPSELVSPSACAQEAECATGLAGTKNEANFEASFRLPNEASKPSMSPAELESLVAERAARQAARQIIEEGQTAILQAAQGLVTAHEQMTGQWCERTVNLAILVARRVIARELRTQPDIVADLVREGLEVLNVRDKVRVHLGHEFAVVKDALVAQFSAMGTMIEANLDSTLPAYGCVVETEVGSVNESVENRLSTLLEAMTVNRED